jgi:hypothetical protein
MSTTRLRKHMGNPKYRHLSERLEALKERHEQGLLNSVEVLKHIDSPLLVYEEPDVIECDAAIKKHFWQSVKISFPEAQVIIIENSHRLPGDGALDGVKAELLTGNDQGRRGFIPHAGDAA